MRRDTFTRASRALALLAIALFSPAHAENVPGGWRAAAIDADHRSVLFNALAEDIHYGTSVKDMRICIRTVRSIEEQVVSGMNYRFHVDGCVVDSTEMAGECEGAQSNCVSEPFVVSVYEQPWNNILQIDDIAPDGQAGDAAAGGEQGISDEEKAAIDEWIKAHDLNQFGDPKSTMYTGGSPLFDESTGQRVDRYAFIVQRHPNRPWDETPMPTQEPALLTSTGNANVRAGHFAAQAEPSHPNVLATMMVSLAVLGALVVLIAAARVRRQGHHHMYTSITSREV